jgi:hypothetical protein
MDARCNAIRVLCNVARIVAVVVLAGAAGCASRRDTAPDQWQTLFNGRDFTGWTVKCTPADQGKDFWRVEDGCIVADSMGRPDHDYVWLVTDREYSDFVLRLRFQAFRDNPGNSGVQIRSRYDDQAGWLDGPQVDINPPGPWRTGMIWDETRGSGRWLFPPVPKGQWVNQAMANPDLTLYYADQEPAWNSLEIAAVGTTISATLNGIPVTYYDGAGILDDETHKQRGVGLKGHIALQIHIKDQLRIRFKDIVLREPVP